MVDKRELIDFKREGPQRELISLFRERVSLFAERPFGDSLATRETKVSSRSIRTTVAE